MEDFYRGVYFGLAYGDAFGAPFEFRNNRNRRITSKLVLPIETLSRFQGVRHGAVGQVTDDTEMTIALLKTIIENGEIYSEEDVVGSYLTWANSTSMLGINTRKLFKGIKTIKGFKNRWSKTDFSDKESNGCLMRCTGLLPALNRDNLAEVSGVDVSLTNDNETCRECVRVYLSAILYFREGNSDLRELALRLTEEIESPKVRKVFNSAANKKPRSVTNCKGWILHALYCAFYYLFYGETFHDSIEEIVKKGGDTDTNAAIAGALLGARWGWRRIRSESIVRKNWRTIKGSDTTQGDYPRPEDYSVGRLVKLVSELS